MVHLSKWVESLILKGIMGYPDLVSMKESTICWRIEFNLLLGLRARENFWCPKTTFQDLDYTTRTLSYQVLLTLFMADRLTDWWTMYQDLVGMTLTRAKLRTETHQLTFPEARSDHKAADQTVHKEIITSGLAPMILETGMLLVTLQLPTLSQRGSHTLTTMATLALVTTKSPVRLQMCPGMWCQSKTKNLSGYDMI